MSEARKKSDWPVVVALALVVLVPVAAYVGGYFMLSTTTGYGQPSIRVFHTSLETRIFEPAAKVESLCTGHKVTLLPLDMVKDST